MRKNDNQEQIEGRIYQHSLEKKVSNSEKTKGTEYINGTIDVATDEAGTNIIQVHYTFVTATNKNGNKNPTYGNLQRIIEGAKTIVEDGIENAWKVRLTPAAALNDFYPQGQDDLVSQPRNEGGFVSIISELHPARIERNKFTFDTLITNVRKIEADESKGIAEDYVEMKVAIFNFRNDILPFTLTVRNTDGMNYFLNLGATPNTPVYTKLWGKISNRTEVSTRKVESAFGGDAVDTVQKRVREWVVTGAQREPYAFGTEGVMTKAEVEKAIENRNVMLADVKKRSEDYYSKKGTAAAAAPIPAGGFDF